MDSQNIRIRLRAFDNKLLDNSTLEIINTAPSDNQSLVRADLWWKERQIISRSLIYKKKYQQAYNVSSKHFLNKDIENQSSAFAEAEWMSGWIALTFLNNAQLALKHFNNF